MLAKNKVEYAVPFRRHDQAHQHLTNDPVECEEFLAELLERGYKITNNLHEGVALPRLEFDRMINRRCAHVPAHLPLPRPRLRRGQSPLRLAGITPDETILGETAGSQGDGNRNAGAIGSKV